MFHFKAGFLSLRTTVQHKTVTCAYQFAMWCSVVLATGCATAELTQRTVGNSVENYYRNIHIKIVLSATEDTDYVTERVVTELAQRDLRITPSRRVAGISIPNGPGTALLRIEEIERRTESVVQHRTYGRTALTQMRGREIHDKPVITLRATLSDAQSGQTVYQANFITQGPWYTNSAAVASALAKPLAEQLEHEGFIAPRR